jgi:hypothetical protein
VHIYSTAPRSLIELEIEIRARAANSAAGVVIELASSIAMATEKGAYFEISTVTLPQKEVRMTLFVHQVVSGAKKNQQVVVPREPIGFGVIAANDWTVFDGVGSGANLVGNARGMHVCGAMNGETWNIYFDLIFNNGRLVEAITYNHMDATLSDLSL